jgi:hypothetical protein
MLRPAPGRRRRHQPQAELLRPTGGDPRSGIVSTAGARATVEIALSTLISVSSYP